MWYGRVMTALIVASLLPLCFKGSSPVLETIEYACVLVFIADYLARWATAYPGEVVVVSNEVGLGIVPMHPLSRDYRDRLGRVNQTIARHADLAQLVVAGRTLTLDPLED